MSDKRADRASSGNSQTGHSNWSGLETLEPRLLLSTVTLTGVPDWVEQGAGEITNGQVQIGADDPVVGAIETIAVASSDPDLIYVGAVNGGIWKTTNGTAADPTWTPLDDQLPSLAIGSIAFSPLDATNQTVFAGTGRFSNGFRGGPAVGVLRTTDGGATWTLLGEDDLGGNRIRSIVPTSLTEVGQVLLVAMVDGGGVMRSNDGGANWVGVTGLPAGSATDLIADPNDVNGFYAALPGQGVYRSTDGGVNWVAVNTGIAGIAGSTNIELAAHDAGASTVLYAGVVDANQQLSGVFRSADDGANWAAIGAAPNIHPGGQGFNNFSIVADTTDSNMVYVGGDRATASPWVGNLFRGDASAGTWTAITKAGANNTAPHADSRDMAFDSNGDILQADDGGIYRLTDPRGVGAGPTWSSVIGAGTLRPTEFYSIAYDSVNNIIFGGTQDVGSPEQTASGTIGAWDDIHQADGNTQAVDNSGPNSIRYSLSNNFNSTFVRRTFDNTNTLIGTANVTLNGLNATDAAMTGFSIIPYVLNTINPTRMLIGRNGMYESADQGDNLTDITIAGQNGYTAFAYGGRSGGVDNEEVIYAGVGGNIWLRTAAAPAAFTELVAYPGGTVLDIVLDPEDWRTAYVIDSNQVFMTDDAGTTWTELTGDLGDLTSSLRSVELYTSAGGDVLLTAGEYGVFRTPLDGSASPVWTEYGKELPKVLVNDIRYYSGDDVLVAGTFGRGAWTVPNVSSSITTNGTLQIDGNPADDVIRLILNQANTDFVDVFINNDTGTPDGSFELAELLNIQVNGLGGNDELVVDSSNGLIELTDGIQFDGGMGFDALTLQQTGGDTQTTDTYSVGAETGAGTSIIVGPSGTQEVYFQNLEPVVDLVAAATLTVNATGADNAINYAVGSVAANGLITIDGLESIEFSNKTALVINGAAGSDEIEMNNPNTPTGLTGITVNGGDPTATDTLIVTGTTGADAIGYTPTSADAGSAAITGLPTIAFTGIEAVVIDGQGGNDALTVNGTAGADTAALTPGADVDSGQVLVNELVAMNFEDLGAAGTLTIAAAAGSDVLVYNGTAASDTMTVSAVGTVGLIVNQSATHINVLQTGVEGLVINALAGDDDVTINGAGTPPYTTIGIDGGSPSASDTVHLVGDGTAVSVTVGDGSGAVTGGGLGTVSLDGVELLDVDAATGDLGINGTSDDDSAEVTPLGANSGTAQINGESPVVDFSDTGTVTVDLAGGFDQLVVNGTQGADSITVVGGAVTVTDATPVTREAINYANIESLTVNSLAGDDTIDVTPSATIPIFVDGGDPVGTTAGDTLVIQAGGGAVSVESGPENDEGSVTVAANERVSYDHIEALTIAGPGAAIINGTNGPDAITIIARDASTHVLADGVQDFTSSVNDGMEILWVDAPSVTVNALAGSDEIVVRFPAPNLAVWNVTVTINGGVPSASDRLVIETPGTDIADYTPLTSESGTLVITALSTTINIDTIEELVYDGEAGDDTLSITGTGTFAYRPGLTVDAGVLSLESLLPVEFTNLGSAGGLSVLSGGASDALMVEGTDYDDAYTVTPTTVQLNSQLVVTHDLAAGEALELQGGDPSSDSDAVTVTGTAGADTIGVDVDAQSLTGVGPAIDLVGIEDLTVNGGGGVDTVNITEFGFDTTSDLHVVELNVAGASILNVTGTSGDDTTEVTPTAAGTGTIEGDGVLPTVLYDGFGGAFTVNGGAAGFDVLAILGNENANTVSSAASAVTIEGGTVTLGAGLDQLEISTFGDDDTVTLASLTTGIDTVIRGGEGDDALTGSPAVDIIEGGQGDDTLGGLAGNDTLFGEEGNDTLTGGVGDDEMYGGDNADTFNWVDGDGSDLIEGGDGNDELAVTTDVAAGDTLALSRNGTRVDLSRTNLTAFTLDIAQIEQLDLDTSAGADTVTVNDMTDTDLVLVNLDVGADAAADSVTVNGTTGPDDVNIAIDGAVVDVKGLPARVRLANTVAADDLLTVNGNDGDDSIKSSDGVEASVAITLSGGAGDDYLSADATLLGGIGDDVLVSGTGDDTIDGGAGIDRVVARGSGDINFVLTNTTLTGLATVGTATGSDSLTSIEEAQLEGGTLANTFTYGAFTGHVILWGGQGSDTMNLVTSPSAINIDMDLTDYDQTINTSGLTLRLTDAIENLLTGSVFNDKIFIDALLVPRAVDGDLPNKPHVPGNPPIPPGDQLTVDGQREFVTVDRTDADSGTVTAFGYGTITFDDIEKLAIVNTLGTTGLGGGQVGLNQQAYTSAVNYAVQAPGRRRRRMKPQAVANGDLNGDGWQDIVAVSSKGRTSTLSALLGNGDGTFAPAAEFSTGGRRAWDVALADVTGDGVLDAVVGHMVGRNISVLPGVGDGTFGAPTLYTTGTRRTGRRVTALAVGDLDGDLDIDVVTANTSSHRVSVLLNGGGGVFAAPVIYVSGGRRPEDVELVDVDRDGDLDMMVSNRRGRSMATLLNGGAGVFAAPTVFDAGRWAMSLVATDNNIQPGDVTGRYLDFNLDGNADIAVSTRRQYISIFLGDGAGGFTLQTEAKYTNRSARTIAAADVNSDGKVDLILGHNAKNNITVLLGNGNGTFSDPYEFTINDLRRNQPGALLMADFNNDGGVDIGIANAGTHDISILLKNLTV